MTKRLFMVSLLVWCAFARTTLAEDIRADTGRDYLIHVWQTDKGLPQNWVSSIAQTPDGYLWVGTRYGGVARFDGVRFVPYSQLDTAQLKDVQVEHLTVDEIGRLWIIMGNESVTTYEHGHFQLMRDPRSDPRMRLDHVLCIRSNVVLFAGENPYLGTVDLSGTTNHWELFAPGQAINPNMETFLLDQDNNVWFVTMAHRLARFSNHDFEFIPDGLPNESVDSLAADANRQIWVATSHHFGILNGEKYSDRTPTNGVSPNGILQISFSGDGGLWVLEADRIRKFLHGQWVTRINSEKLLSSITSGAFSLHGDAQGNAWLVANGRGLLHCKSDGTADLLTEQSGLPNNFITCWFQDAEGDIWIGLHGGGIALIRERLFHSFGQADGLPGKVVSSLCMDDNGKLWAGTMSGNVAYLRNGRFENLPLEASEGSPNESITVFPANGGGVWIGSLNHGLQSYNDGKFSTVNTPWPTIRTLFGDNEDRLWVGGLVNLCYINREQYRNVTEADGFVNSHAIGAMAEDTDGTIWIGTGPGELWKYADGKFTRFGLPPDWPTVRFCSVLPDTNGVVWVGTLGGGLLCFQNGQFTRCLKSDGLPDNNIPQLLDSRDGYLWGGTYAGIFRAKKSDLIAIATGMKTRLPCQVYGEFDGLPALECSSGFQPSCWRSDDGHLLFATANGVASIDPEKIVPNQIQPTVIIEEMLVDGKPTEVSSRIGAPLQAEMMPHIEVPPGRHYVQFRFTGLNYAAPDAVRFRVQLEGGDSKWQDIGGQRSIGYGPLLPGNYQFHAIACNNDGVWNEEGDVLAFTVLPYFWETWWFKIGLGLVTLLALGIVASLIQRQRYRRRIERAERQHEMEQERARIARDLHDDLGTGLTQISMLSAQAYGADSPSGKTKELIQEVRGRAKEMVIALDEIVWAANPKNDSLNGLVTYLGHFAEEFYKPTNIRFRLDIPPQLPALPLSAESRHHLFLAFKEAVNNTARHSKATQVQMRVEILADEIIVQVEDNGCGFENQADADSQGNGLINMKRRLEQIRGRTEIKSKSGEGTSVIFHISSKKRQ